MKRIIYNPVFKDSCTFLRTSSETNGKYSEMEVVLAPGGANPLHRHSAFAETFTVLEGTLGLTLSGKELVLNTGETVTVQRGQAHRFYNPGGKDVRFHLLFAPGHAGAENLLRIMYGLAEDGKTDKKGIPNLLTIAVVGEIGDSSLAGIHSLLAPLLKVLAFLGRAIGLEQQLLNRYCGPEVSSPTRKASIL